MVFTSGIRKDMAAAKSKKQARLNYTNQPFARQFFVALLHIKLLTTND